MTGMLKLLERQFAMWELNRRLQDLGQRPGRCLDGAVAYGPCLLVSRERGSGGDRVAGLAGERLGWHVFNREVVDEIAQLAHVRQQLIQSVDEHVRASWEDDWRPELEAEDIGAETYLLYLRQVVRALGHQGDVVIVGRGAQYLLPPKCALRARVVAPFELRARRVAERAKLPLEQAKSALEKYDADRTAFIRKSFKCDPGSPLNYDLVVNTGEIGIEAAAEIVLTSLREKLGVRAGK